MLRFSRNAVSVHRLGCPEGKRCEGEMGQVGESAFLFFFACILYPKMKMPCSEWVSSSQNWCFW